MRALIVEDDQAIRDLLDIILSVHGDCTFAVNGQEAVEAFERAWEADEPYDLICMDIRMPKLSGLDALHWIRRYEKKKRIRGTDAVKVVMTTGLSDSKEVIESLYKGGASAYFVKPLDLRAFVDALKNLGLIEGQPAEDQ